MIRETLDEAIDRVAAAMTAVPARPVHREIGEGPHREIGKIREFTFLPKLAGLPVLLVAAATVLLAVLVLDRPREMEPAVLESTLPRVNEAARAAPVAPVVETAAPVPARREGTVHEVVEPHIPPRPAIAALTEPSGLTVGELNLESLAIAPVEVTDLEDLPSLELSALETIRPGEFR